MPTNRDGVRYGAERDLYAILVRARTACVLTDRDGVRATDRDDERHGAGPDGERTVGTAFDMRCGYDRCGSEPCASVTERALRALLDEFTASARPAATRTSTANPVAQGARGAPSKVGSGPRGLGIVSSFVMKPIGEPGGKGSARSTV